MAALQNWLDALFDDEKTTNPGPTKFWKRRRIFKLSAHFYGRRRNCYSVAVKAVHKAMQYARKGRKLRMKDNQELAVARVNSSAEELGTNSSVLLAGLRTSNIYLNYRSLSDLAIWEPRTFKALNNFAWFKCAKEGLSDIHKLGDPPKGVILRGMMKK